MKYSSLRFYFFSLVLLLVSAYLSSCSLQKKIDSQAHADILNAPDLKGALVGISLFDPAANNFLYNYQGDKYFVPASNTKLFSLYAGLKYLGDSLIGLRYMESDTAVLILPSGDPSLLHPDYLNQPVIDFLKRVKKKIVVSAAAWDDQALGAGWAWDDYNDDYMPERSPMPVYGNTIRWVQQTQSQANQDTQFVATPSVYSIPDISWKVHFTTDPQAKNFFVKRRKDENVFDVTQGTEKYKTQDVPFVTNGISAALELLKDTLGKEIYLSNQRLADISRMHTLAIHSRPVDSLFTPMMHRSDNFFAEQTLLMVSGERLGIMNDEKITDSLLKTDLKDLPQKPAWADGSGLSRFNLFTPQDFIWLLNNLKNEFGIERMKRILPTGGTGTLGRYYKQDSGYIFAKTGSLSGVICLSGYLLTKKNHLLLFSVLVNNHRGKVAGIRKAVAVFIDRIREKY